MRHLLLLFAIFCLTRPALAQYEDSSADTGGPPPAPRALPVGNSQQDAEGAREKLLKASDELDMIQSNSEAAKVEIDRMKTDIAALQNANADLKQQLATTEAALDKEQAARIKERQVLVDEVAQLVATHSAAPKASAHRHSDEAGADVPTHTHDSGNDSSEPAPSTEVHHSRKPAHVADSAPALAPPEDPAPAPKPQKGYYHVVESGETLTMICAAYRDQGVKVSVSEVKKANGLSGKGTLKVGQKLFIPKPGT